MTVTIAFVGDTLLGHSYQTLLREHSHSYLLEGIAPLLARADLTVVNHEGVLLTSSRGKPRLNQRDRFWMRADPKSAATLKSYGVRVVSLANNHVLDYGQDGLSAMTATLDAYGIEHCGAGVSEEEARRTVVVEHSGVRVGFVSCLQSYEMYEGWMYAEGDTGGCNRLDENALRTDLQRLAHQADTRIVLVHWGRNYRDVTPVQEAWAPKIVSAGADLVIGHHPHVVQRVEIVHSRPVVYSLGNGPFGTRGRFEQQGVAPYGLIALAKIDDAGRLAALELHLIDVDNQKPPYRPMPIWDDRAVPFLRSLTTATDGWQEHHHALRLDLASANRSR